MLKFKTNKPDRGKILKIAVKMPNFISMKTAASILNVGRNNLFEFLREEDILMCDNLPRVDYIVKGYFKVVSTQVGDYNLYFRPQVCCPEGLVFLYDFLCSKKIQGELI